MTGLFELARDWICQPKLKVDCQGNEANRVRKDDELYVRVRVENTGFRPAKAKAFLTSLTKIASGEPETSLLHDSMLLRWAGGALTRELPNPPPGGPAVPFYVDVVKSYKDKNEWEFCVELFFGSYSHLKIHSGTYRIGLAVTADGATAVACEIDVFFNGDLDKVTVTQWPKPVSKKKRRG